MKIYIIGSVGSGKTTLARKLASMLGLPHYETDNFVWSRSSDGDRRNSNEVRDVLFRDAIQQPGWIVEGVHLDWTEKGFLEAEYIIFLDIPVKTRSLRIIKRYFRQILGIEQSNYKPTFTLFRRMFVWNQYFENEMRPKLLQRLLPYDDKLLIIKGNDEIEKLKQTFTLVEGECSSLTE